MNKLIETYKKQPFKTFIILMVIMGSIDYLISTYWCLTCNDNAIEGGIGFGMLGFFYGLVYVRGGIKDRFSNAWKFFMINTLVATFLFLIFRLLMPIIDSIL